MENREARNCLGPAARLLPLDRRLPGTAVQPAENAYHRLGHVLAAGPDRARVEEDLVQARALLRVDVE